MCSISRGSTVDQLQKNRSVQYIYIYSKILNRLMIFRLAGGKSVIPLLGINSISYILNCFIWWYIYPGLVYVAALVLRVHREEQKAPIHRRRRPASQRLTIRPWNALGCGKKIKWWKIYRFPINIPYVLVINPAMEVPFCKSDRPPYAGPVGKPEASNFSDKKNLSVCVCVRKSFGQKLNLRSCSFYSPYLFI